MWAGRRVRILGTLIALSACATPLKNDELKRAIRDSDRSPPPSSPVRWRAYSCIATLKSLQPGWTRQDIADRCKSDTGHNFIAVAVSGGGVKAAVFGGEALFYLDALGVLPNASVVSSVSG